MRRLLACPFCRELYPEGERTHCAECEDVRLVSLEELPPTFEETEAEALHWEARAPEDVPLAWSHFSHGRGALLLSSTLGLIAFAGPWIEMSLPELASYSGLELARSRLPWLWGGFFGWVLLVLLVLRARTVRQMRGLRVVAVTLPAMTLVEVLMLVLMPPRRGEAPVDLEWGPGLYASGLMALTAMLFAVRFGKGAEPKLGDAPKSRSRPPPERTRDGHPLN